MDLLIVRHADAGDPDDWLASGKPDADRPISDKGRRQLKRLAKALELMMPSIGFVASSPYVRAVQTAEALFAESTMKTTDALIPEAEPEEFVRWVETQRSRKLVVAVGHEPHLSLLATWLICGLNESRLELKKSGACLISFEKRPGAGQGTLQWLIGPKQLKR